MASFFCATDERNRQCGRLKASNGQTSPPARHRCRVSGWHRFGLYPVVGRPRVMQLVLSLSPGGTERLVIEICKQLAERIEPMVCCLDERGAWARELESLGIPVVALGRRPGLQPELSRQIARLITASDIDILHCHHYSPYVYGLMA